MDVDALLEEFRVDLPHARQVAELSLAMFDALRDRYELPGASRRLLEIGALLHNVGMTIDPADHHLVGRDIVLRQDLDDLSLREQMIVACLVAFHRKKVRPQAEPAFLGLGKKAQAQALRLAAILRVADGLDYGQSQATRLLGLELSDAGPSLHLAGPQAAGDGVRALAKADLWHKVFDEELTVLSDAGAPSSVVAATAVEADPPPLAPWYAAPHAPLAELGRVLLRRNFRRMLSAERDVRADEDIEAIHALRVSTRRLRASLRLLAPVAPEGEMRPFVKTIQRLAGAAGAVRDRDVLLEHLAASRDALPADTHAGLDALAETLREERSDAYDELIERLDGAEHAAFKQAFARCMNEHAGWNDVPRVRDLAGSTIWRHYEALRAYDRDGLPTEVAELHAMRIVGKRLRYVLELFADSFGPRGEQAVTPLMAFQDHLGLLNDIDVSRAALAGIKLAGPARAAADAYLALRETESADLLQALPARWERVGNATYRRKLLELIVRL